MSNVKDKVNLFNCRFAKQCSLLCNSSELPHEFLCNFSTFLQTFEINPDIIVDIIKSLDPNKAHGHDGVSVRMLKLCSKSTFKPLPLTFNNCLRKRIFPELWKKANVVPIDKKGNRRLLSNYLQIH